MQESKLLVEHEIFAKASVIERARCYRCMAISYSRPRTSTVNVVSLLCEIKFHQR